MKYFLAILPVVAAATTSTSDATEVAAQTPVLGIDTVHGCYSSVGELKLNETNSFNTQGSCASACREAGAYVGATKSNACYCGDKYPPASTFVDDSLCNVPCPGYDALACGGTKAYTVLNIGLKVDVENSTDSSSSEGSTASSSATVVSSSTSLATASGTTATPTGSGSSTSSSAPASTSSTAAVSTNGAVSHYSLSGFGMAILGMGTMLLL